MNIKIDKNEIFAYVTSLSQYDAIEKIIDPNRYEVFDCGIYDNQTKKMLPQSEEYKEYCYLVSELRKTIGEISPPVSDVLKLCFLIAASAPTEINLGE